MKRIFLLTLFALMAGVGLHAQQAAGQGRGAQLSPEERATFTVKRMTATVELTSEEQTQVTEIFKNFYTDQEPLRAERNRTKMLELANARDEKVKAALNNETKYNAYLKFMEAQRNRSGGRSKGNGGGRRS